jgi:hypothetical protein
MESADIKIITKDEKYLITVKNLRSRNFSKNLPFLILSEQLPDGQVYREFPDGRMELREMFAEGPKFKSKVIQVLKAPEADRVRKEYGLF